ncbi:MAG: DUF1232 domain-containing protein [Betaproteobacteria bacterium]|nr:DUF1232 domain-containing protein [Betaproteobacteria bacterium]
MINRLRHWAKALKAQTVTLWFCYRDPQTPLMAKLLAIAVVAYAFSPIDFIPDFIPVLGFLDDALLLPVGIWLALKFIPKPVYDKCRGKADQWLAENNARPTNWLAAAIIVLLWVALAWLCWKWFFA